VIQKLDLMFDSGCRADCCDGGGRPGFRLLDPGIRQLYQKAVKKAGDSHAAEHQLMECLGRMLWEAQRGNRAPDEQAYLQCIKHLVGK